MWRAPTTWSRSEEHTSELQSLRHLACRLLLEKTKAGGKLNTLAATNLGPPGQTNARAPRSRSLSGNIRFRRHRRPLFRHCVSAAFFLNDRAPAKPHPLSLPDILPI